MDSIGQGWIVKGQGWIAKDRDGWQRIGMDSKGQ